MANLANSKPSQISQNPGKKWKGYDLGALASEWLYYEGHGTRLRMAHRCVEWDGWEEGLVESILGPEDLEEEWFKEVNAREKGVDDISTPPPDSTINAIKPSRSQTLLAASLKRLPPPKLPSFAKEEKEQMLNTTGDICGGRGGELGRRLEAWLCVNGIANGVTDDTPVIRRWHDEGLEYEAEAE